ncbi:MAG: type VI secretion system protein TssA [Candidatus Korobacteraceae bacterium]
MPLREDLLNPIAGENPSGSDLRYNTEQAFYDRIQEARRQDDDLPVGDWQHERKVANYAEVLKLSQDAIATQSKDLQVAAWLTEALLRKEGFAGLVQGLQLCQQLLATYWDTIYPLIDDGDAELRAKPLSWLGTTLDIPVKTVPLTASGYDWLKYKDSRTVGYEAQAQTDAERKKRNALLASGKLAAEAFDKAFDETPKSFYAKAEKDIDNCLSVLAGLDKFCDEKFSDAAPSFNHLKTSLTEVRHTVHGFLEKKRELEPDPVEVTAEVTEGSVEEVAAGEGKPGHISVPAQSIVIPLAGTEPPDRREAIAAVSRAAAALRKQQPGSPAPYLMMRGLRWGELRTSQGLTDPSLLEAPSTELRQHLKRLALAGNWTELLEVAENAMSLPCSRAWLDLQHLVVLACSALGSEYEAVGTAITSELQNLVRDMPKLLDATLLDGTPAANRETRAWISMSKVEPAPAPPPVAPPSDGEAAVSGNGTGEAATASPPPPAVPASSGWWQKASDAYALAQAAIRAGNIDKGIAIMREEIGRQQSGRARFQRTLQFVRLCVEAGNDAIVQPMIEDAAQAVEEHKLDNWEDREMVADALVLIMKTSKRVQGDAKERQRLFERVCRLDPVRALHAG